MRVFGLMLIVLLSSNCSFSSEQFDTQWKAPTEVLDLGEKSRKSKRIGKKRKRKCRKWAKKCYAG